MITLNWCVDLISKLLSGLFQLWFKAGIVTTELHHLLGNNTTLSMGTGRELMTRCANAITSGEETVNGGHTVISPLVLVRTRWVGNVRNPIFLWTRGPDTTATGVRAEHVGFGWHNLRTNLLWLDIGTGPQTSLTNRHIKEIFPSLRLKMLPILLHSLLIHTGCFFRIQEGVQGNISCHVDWATSCLQLIEHQVVTQTGRSNGRRAIRHELLKLVFYCWAVGIELTKTILYFSLEQKEPGTNRTVTILETGWGETILHHGQGSANLGTHGVGGTGIPYWIPGTAFTLTGRAWAENVNRTTAGNQGGLATEYMNFILTGGETNRTSNLVGLVLVKQHLHDKDTLKAVLGTKSGLGWLSNDTLIRLTVDHDLPFTGTNRSTTLTKGLGRGSTVKVVALGIKLPDWQTPFFEQLYGLIHVTTTVINKVFTNNAHKVITNHLYVIFDWVFADIGVDSRKSLGNSTGTLHRSLINEGNLHTSRGPLHDLKSSAAGSHTATNDENVNIMLDDLWIYQGSNLTIWFIW